MSIFLTKSKLTLPDFEYTIARSDSKMSPLLNLFVFDFYTGYTCLTELEEIEM
jgi:hypothetical protein